MNHYNDPYSTTSIMESKEGFFRGSNGDKWSRFRFLIELFLRAS